MVRGLIFCAIACGIAAPATAVERSAAVPAARAIPNLIVPVARRAPALRSVLSIFGDFAVKRRGRPDRAMVLANFEKQKAESGEMVMPQIVRLEQTTLGSPFAMSSLRTMPAWRLSDKLPAVTARANGNYAVRDTLADYRKPRAFRPSPLSAMLVLRIDGKDESPPFSVGGGGVAAALWRFKQP